MDGATAFQLRLAAGLELDYAVFDGKLVIVHLARPASRAVARAQGSLADNEAVQTRRLARRPKQGDVASLPRLQPAAARWASSTGLADCRAYLAVRDDLRKVRAVGAARRPVGASESTTELFLQIP